MDKESARNNYYLSKRTGDIGLFAKKNIDKDGTDEGDLFQRHIKINVAKPYSDVENISSDDLVVDESHNDLTALKDITEEELQDTLNSDDENNNSERKVIISDDENNNSERKEMIVDFETSMQSIIDDDEIPFDQEEIVCSSNEDETEKENSHSEENGDISSSEQFSDISDDVEDCVRSEEKVNSESALSEECMCIAEKMSSENSDEFCEINEENLSCENNVLIADDVSSADSD
ncbi:probable serine/threonine-protein kinase DDB_G0283337 [Mercenaria mercenaria]|uniref:probable serine/threonine-protein kinase DDB_G0283337 n=1 Tax=Mercenaria mercenaria TaxID=6596 RepID=UPI00234F13FF|nr:probable serine/threonine-protein kinase DDB_G0283337 [Mercenaria mercenaria]